MMPKFVSNSSGHIYAKNNHKEEEDEILLAALNQQDESNGVKKPAAVNKKGTRQKQKSSLEQFKEELQKLNEEREEQRNKLKNSLPNASSQQPAPIPLKPDPRCPTALTLQVNLTPRPKDAPSTGSFDTGDPTTTNLYIGNLNPTVTENELCDIFGKFGPLASIKIMWPRTEEERARNRNSGFVAYMSRTDGERAVRAINGMEYKGYDMKLSWGKAVPLPKNPVFVPDELEKLLHAQPRSGLPFNAQLHEDDIKRGYIVPIPHPQRIPPQFESQIETDESLRTAQATYKEFIEVFRRSTVHVRVPLDRGSLDKIHKTIEYVIREGPVFESIIMARETNNHEFAFLYDYDSPDHVYYRWKLYSILHGNNPYVWPTEEFRMYDEGPLWRPPPLNPYAEGMPLELVEKLSGVERKVLTGELPSNHRKSVASIKTSAQVDNIDAREKGILSSANRKTLDDLLKDLDPTKTKVGSAMLFCINHSDSAEDIISRISNAICSGEASYKRHIGLVFLISDVLHNSSAAVTNASFYREGLKRKLVEIFQSLRKFLDTIQESHQAERFKKKVLSVLGSWNYYQLYEDDFVVKLSRVLYGESGVADNPTGQSLTSPPDASNMGGVEPTNQDPDGQLDGQPIDDSLLAECLEAKGLSLRWYKTLDLSEDECEQDE